MLQALNSEMLSGSHSNIGTYSAFGQAIMLTIDQYAETALGNRQFFLNRPHGIGGKNDKIP